MVGVCGVQFSSQVSGRRNNCRRISSPTLGAPDLNRSELSRRGNPLTGALLAQVQLLNDRLVTLAGAILEVIKKTAARGNHLEKAAT